ncbi:MAG: amidase [Acetobacteraceae bacterium]
MATTLAMSWEEWGRTDGIALADLVRTGKLTRGELAAQAAAGVARVNPRLEAVIEVFEDVLADPGIDRPDPAGALAGVPIFLKDLGSGLKGRRQEAGSALLAGTVLGQTDPLVTNYLRAGMVPLGRSTTPEFGLTFDTVTDYRGSLRVSRNPWNLERTPGGSSGGSAAAVAAGVTPISMATDGGGSIRIPASFCGLVGLKPSRGRVAPPFARNEYVSRTSVEGVVTRSVRDTAAVLDYITAGPKGGSFIRMAPPAGSYLDALRSDPAPLRIALSTGDWGRATRTDPEVAARVREVARVLEGLGHHVEEIGDREICAWETLWRGFITGWVGSRLMFKTMAERRGLSEAQLHERLEPMTWRHYVAAQRYSVLDMFAMMEANNTVTRQWGALMTRYDALLCPAIAIRVAKANGPYSLLLDEEIDPWINRLTDAARYTMPANETGLAAISLPAGRDTDGLPIGVQLYGDFGREDLLLGLAAQLERARGEWFGAVPPVHVGGAG